MNSSEDQPDELQRIWQRDNNGRNEQNHAMMIELLREKQRSFQDFVHRDDYAGYMIVLIFAPLTAFAAWKAYPLFLMQLGYLIWTALFVTGAVVAWIAARKSRILLGIDSSIVEYHRELQQLYERRIRFLRSIKYWFSIPFIIGMYLVLSPIAGRILEKPWNLFLVVGLMLLFWFAVWYQNDVSGVKRLEARKSEIDRLLDQMNKP